MSTEYEICFNLKKKAMTKDVDKIANEFVNFLITKNINKEELRIQNRGSGAAIMLMSIDEPHEEFLTECFEFLLGKKVVRQSASIYIEDVGESFYYTYSKNELLAFDTEEELNEFFSPVQSSIESNFFKSTKNDDSVLIRLRIKAKKKREIIYNLFLDLLNSNDKEEPLINLTETLNELLIKQDDDDNITWDFPNYDSYGKTYKGSATLCKDITFIFEEKNYLYLGFMPKNLKDILWDYDGMSSCNKPHLQTNLEMLETITDDIKAKARKKSDAKSESLFGYYDGIHRADIKRLQDNVWTF